MQVTVATSFFKKIDSLSDKIEVQVKAKASAIVSQAVDLSPVDTGAFVESWMINPRGDRTRRARSPSGRPSLIGGEKQAKRETEKARLLSRVASFDFKDLDGFTVTNTAPHVGEMNKREYFRDGRLSPSEIQAILKDTHR